MTINDIVTLAHAGFTAQQIAAFNGMAQQAPMQQAPMQQAPMQQAPMQQAPMQQAPMQQAPMQQAPMQQAPMQQDVNAILQSIAGLQQTIQNNNVANTEQAWTPSSADQILASVINPPDFKIGEVPAHNTKVGKK